MFFLQHCFRSEQHFYPWPDFFNVIFVYQTWIQIFQTDLFEYSTQSSLVIHNSSSIYYPVLFNPYCKSVMYQFSRLTIMTYSSPRRLLRSHYLVCSENNLFFVEYDQFATKGCNLCFDRIDLNVPAFYGR